MSAYDYDAPADDPLFDFGRLSLTIAETLKRERIESAFVLGLHGPWGSGKTTLLKAVGKQLPKMDVVIEFNAWKYQEKEALWRALILRVLAALREAGGNDAKISEMERSLYEAFTVSEKGPLQVNWVAAAAVAVQTTIGLATLGVGGGVLAALAEGIRTVFGQKKNAERKAEDTVKQIERAASVLEHKAIERAVRQVVSIEQFVTLFREVVAQLGSVRRVYVLIDDLDRCLPETALGIFEAIKLFLDAPQCAYVIAVDRAVIRRGLELRYLPENSTGTRILPPIVDPDEYIEKTITLSLDLPILADVDGRSLLSMANLAGRFSAEEVDVIVFVLGTNPRRLKRFGAMVAMWLDVARALIEDEKRTLTFSPLKAENRPLFIKFSLIGYINSGVLAEMRRDPGLPERLQQVCNSVFEQGDATAKTMADRAGKLKPKAASEMETILASELPMIVQAMLDPALLRALRLEPRLTVVPELVVTALRWFRSAVH